MFVAPSNMLPTLASPRRDSGPQQGDVQTALMTAAAPSSGDYAGWRLLASHGPFSGPFVDPHWMLSWTEAFAPQEPVLVCARDGRRLVGSLRYSGWSSPGGAAAWPSCNPGRTR